MKRRILPWIILLLMLGLFACSPTQPERQNFTVSFWLDGKNVMQYEVREGDPITDFPELEEVPGYDWVYDEIPERVTKNTKIVITRTPKSFVVTFDYNEATEAPAQTHFKFKFGYAMSSMPIPVRDGYLFDGYESNGKVYGRDSIYDIASDATMTARWKSLFAYSIEEGSENEIHITEYLGEYNVDKIVIPSETDGKKVVRIARGILENVEVQSLTVPFLGETVGDEDGCLGYLFGLDETKHSRLSRGLKTVTVTDAVSIADEAFSLCSDLTSVDLSSSVLSVGDRAFYNCASLKSVTLTKVKSIGDYAFFGCNNIDFDTLSLTSVEYIGAHAFENCSSVMKVTISASIKEISEFAFFDCLSLRTVNINAGTPPTIGRGVFCCGDSEEPEILPSLSLYVPKNKIENFKQAPGWEVYASKIVAMGGGSQPGGSGDIK